MTIHFWIQFLLDQTSFGPNFFYLRFFMTNNFFDRIFFAQIILQQFSWIKFSTQNFWTNILWGQNFSGTKFWTPICWTQNIFRCNNFKMFDKIQKNHIFEGHTSKKNPVFPFFPFFVGPCLLTCLLPC